jgi:hypothetical protein
MPGWGPKRMENFSALAASWAVAFLMEKAVAIPAAVEVVRKLRREFMIWKAEGMELLTTEEAEFCT